ncbi:hypothetical protein [Sphingobium subterraneum]|uniref:Mannose-6-phosphate isomerase-like protein (Cupin superfamily) n=1 Tax=Sphingobium subterraneum TaxID=627688 RepID=A0A841IZ57_9SPHN|nr:hypothetical protein [Sphingobium subterraneum]MBB6123694.1 mannose-6-phosphate isomerase-like protein (cupin superfamily) [Sphingobium subterraneum]
MKIIRPEDVEPTINPNAAEHRDGTHVHRRILSHPHGGPATLDLGYNVSRVELDVQIPYAYNRDEFCYNVQGSVRAESDGAVVDARQGLFMWRPAGAATQRIATFGDYISICAFAPARTDAWSHRLPAEEVGKWDGDPDKKPRLTFRAWEDVEPEASGDDSPSVGADVRHIFDTPRMQVTRVTLSRDTRLPIGKRGREDIYWLESGTVSASAGTETLTWRPGEFLQVRPGDTVDAFEALDDACFLRWSAPAALG